MELCDYFRCSRALVAFILTGFGLMFGTLSSSSSSSSHCENDAQTLVGRGMVGSCISSYYNNTGQVLPADFELVLKVQSKQSNISGSRPIRSPMNGSQYRQSSTDNVKSSDPSRATAAAASARNSNGSIDNTATLSGRTAFKSQWCRPFQQFYSCLNDVVRQCSQIRTMACRVINIFVANYDDPFCNQFRDPHLQQQQQQQTAVSSSNVLCRQEVTSTTTIPSAIADRAANSMRSPLQLMFFSVVTGSVAAKYGYACVY